MTDAATAFTTFLLTDGLLLVGLFALVTWGVTLLQLRIPFQATQAMLATSSGWRAAFAASVGGVVTPFCSCSTIPVLSGMLRAGVGFAPSFAFLVSSPVVNEGVFILLFLSHGLLPSVTFIAAGLALTSVAGVLAARLGLDRHVIATPAPAATGAFVGAGTPAWPGLRAAHRFAWRAAAAEMRKLAPYLAAGLFVGALIHGALPQSILLDFVHRFPTGSLYAACALIGIPLYISPIAGIPVGLALLEKGFPVGPLVTFLVSAIGTSPPEIVLLFRLFRLPLVIAHTVTVFVCALTLGLVVAAVS